MFLTVSIFATWQSTASKSFQQMRRRQVSAIRIDAKIRIYSSIENDHHIYMCSRYEGSQNGVYVTTFSVPPSAGMTCTIKQRAIVVHEGDDQGGGMWTCSKDRGALQCPHITKAKDSLQQHLQGDVGAHSKERGHTDSFLYDGE